MTESKKNQVIFLEGKEQALQKLFSEDNFGYLAIGYDPNDEGFKDEKDKTILENGFYELDASSNYSRIQLSFLSSDLDYDTGKVLVKFAAELDADNITGSYINQMAIVDNSEISAETTYFSATTFPKFNKTNNSSISFVIGLKL